MVKKFIRKLFPRQRRFIVHCPDQTADTVIYLDKISLSLLQDIAYQGRRVACTTGRDFHFQPELRISFCRFKITMGRDVTRVQMRKMVLFLCDQQCGTGAIWFIRCRGDTQYFRANQLAHLSNQAR